MVTFTPFSSLGPLTTLGWIEGFVLVSCLGALALDTLIYEEFFSVSTALLGPMRMLILGPLVSLFLLMGLLILLLLAILILFMGLPVLSLMVLLIFMGLPVLFLIWSFLTLITMSTLDLVALLFLCLVVLPLTTTLPRLGLAVALLATAQLPITLFVTMWFFLLDLCYKFVLVVLPIFFRLPCLVAVLLPFPRLKSLSLVLAHIPSLSLLSWSP